MQLSATEAYDQLDAALALAEVAVLPAEVHGIIVGALCSHLKTGKRPDLMVLILDRPNEDSGALGQLGELVHHLYRESMEMLLEAEAGFDLVLPHESEALELRTESLGGWCRGFLLGLLHDDSSEMDGFSGDSEEVIEDIVAISGAISGEQDHDQEDWAFAEIEEYLRVGVQLVFEKIYEERAAAAPATEQ